MHKRNIVHRDMKPENVLLESKEQEKMLCKITDFGFSKFFDPREGMSDTLGSPLYMAPEIIKKARYDHKVDIWSLGVMVYILLTGRPPFSGRSKQEIFLQVSSAAINYNDPSWDTLSKESKNFVKRMLVRNPKQRASAEELLNDDWIIMNQD